MSLRGGYSEERLLQRGRLRRRPGHVLRLVDVGHGRRAGRVAAAQRLRERADQHRPRTPGQAGALPAPVRHHLLLLGRRRAPAEGRRPDATRSASTSSPASTGNLVRVYWNQSLVRRPARRAAPTATTRCAATGRSPTRASSPQGDVSTTNIGLFLQDAWTISRKPDPEPRPAHRERERAHVRARRPDGVPEYADQVRLRGQARPARSASPGTSRATARRRSTAPGASSTTSPSSSCPAAPSAATSGWSTTTRSTAATSARSSTTRAARRPAPAACSAGRSTSATSRSGGLRRPRPEADADAGVRARRRARAGPEPLGERPLRAQVARPRDRRHGLPGRATERDLQHRQPGRGPHVDRVRLLRRQRRGRPAQAASATTTPSSSPSTSACPTTGPGASATCGAGCTATTPACRRPTRTAARARTSAACTTTRS